ncbi:MAG: TIGR01777 family oxidoreductase [Verrucomicrobiales bacterium]
MLLGVTGATGFLGRSFCKAAAAARHDVIAFSRTTRPRLQHCAEVRLLNTEGDTDFSGLEALVHLAGEGVLGAWTRKKKQRIRDSRVNLTARVVEDLRHLEKRPAVFVCASAVGYYGDRGDDILTEAAAPGTGFLAEVSRDWESAALEAESFGTRVVSLRFGTIFGVGGGALPVLEKIFAWCLGGRLGSGRQWMSWVHIDDAVQLISHSLLSESMRGPVNAVAPRPVRNAEFTRLFAKNLSRVAILPVPGPILRIFLRDQARMFLDSQRVHPKKALLAGYSFLHPEVESGLEDYFSRPRP